MQFVLGMIVGSVITLAVIYGGRRLLGKILAEDRPIKKAMTDG